MIPRRREKKRPGTGTPRRRPWPGRCTHLANRALGAALDWCCSDNVATNWVVADTHQRDTSLVHSTISLDSVST